MPAVIGGDVSISDSKRSAIEDDGVAAYAGDAEVDPARMVAAPVAAGMRSAKSRRLMATLFALPAMFNALV